MNYSKNFVRAGLAVLALGAAALAGCSGEELARPAGSPPAVELGLDGSAVLETGSVKIVNQPGGVRYLDADGDVVAEFDPAQLNGRGGEGSVDITGYIDGVNLHLAEVDGGTRRFFEIVQALDLPAGVAYVEFVEYLELPAGLQVRTPYGTMLPGDREVSEGAFVLADAERNAMYHMSAPIAWDGAGLDRPWVQYGLYLNEVGSLEIGTRVPSVWLSDGGAVLPLTVAPSVTPGAPAPFVASAYLAPTAPGSNTVSLAATYSNAYNDPLEVRIEWGDGETLTKVTNLQLQELHTYADGTDLVIVTVQLSDFSVDENGDPAPRVVRETLEISLAQSTDDGIPGEGDGEGEGGGGEEAPECGLVSIDEDELDWSDDSDDRNYAREEDEDEGESLGFDVTIDGRTYSHFNVCSNGWVQLTDGSYDAYDRSDKDDIDDFLEDYARRADGGLLLFAAMDNWDPDYRGGYYGFKKEADQVTFFWQAATWRDADDRRGSGAKCEFSIVVRADGYVLFSFGEDNHERKSYDLFTGLYLPSEDDWRTGTIVEIAEDEFPDGECFVYPGDYPTSEFEDD